MALANFWWLLSKDIFVPLLEKKKKKKKKRVATKIFFGDFAKIKVFSKNLTI